MSGSSERLTLPHALTDIAENELQRQEAFRHAAHLIYNIYYQTSTYKEVKDANGEVIIRGETPAVPVDIGGKEYSMTIADAVDYVHAPNKNRGWHCMRELSIRISDPSAKAQPVELARAISEGKIIKGFVRKTGYKTYEAMDTKTAALQEISTLLGDYGEAVGYDPSMERPVAIEATLPVFAALLL